MGDPVIFNAEATAALMQHICGGRTQAALDALEQGADPNGTDAGDAKNSPLILCALYHQPLVARELLARGADPDYARPGGQTALMMVGLSNDRATARLIVDAGANILRQNSAGEDAMMRCHRESNRALAGLLVQWAQERDARKAAEAEARERRQNVEDIVSAVRGGLAASVTMHMPLRLKGTAP